MRNILVGLVFFTNFAFPFEVKMKMQSPNNNQVDSVLKYIKEELYSGRLHPGERLPAERKLAEQLGVGRAHVRAAFQKLEFYGIVQTFPQSGTVVAQEKMQVLERMITDALQNERYDFASLVHVRVLLEIEAARLCARKADFQRQIEHKGGIARLQAGFEGAAVIAVDDPFVPRNEFVQFFVEFLFCEGGFVRLVPDHVQIVEGQARLFL